MSYQYGNDPGNQNMQLMNRINQLENEIRMLRMSGRGSSGLQSPNFLARAFAVWGHYFVAQLIITIVIGIIFFCISIVLGGSLLGALTGYY